MGLINRIQVWLYDLIKVVITAILLVIIVLFFLRFCAPDPGGPDEWPTPVPTATAPSPTVVPTVTAVPPVTVGPPTLKLPDPLEVGEIELGGTAPGADKVRS